MFSTISTKLVNAVSKYISSEMLINCINNYESIGIPEDFMADNKYEDDEIVYHCDRRDAKWIFYCHEYNIYMQVFSSRENMVNYILDFFYAGWQDDKWDDSKGIRIVEHNGELHTQCFNEEIFDEYTRLFRDYTSDKPRTIPQLREWLMNETTKNISILWADRGSVQYKITNIIYVSTTSKIDKGVIDKSYAIDFECVVGDVFTECIEVDNDKVELELLQQFTTSNRAVVQIDDFICTVDKITLY